MHPRGEAASRRTIPTKFLDRSTYGACSESSDATRATEIGMSNSGTARARLGLFHEVEDLGGVAVGRSVAVNQSLLALGRYARAHHATVFCDPRRVRELGIQLAPAGLRVAPRRSLLETGEFTPEVWHDSQFDTHRPFALRERLGGAYPVTLVHHTVSYPYLLHDVFLRLLLSDTREHDAVFCTSVAARTAVGNLLDQVGKRFSERYGVQRRFAGSLEVIPLGVDIDRFRPLGSSPGRDHFDLPPDAFVLLWVGRMSLADKADLLPLVTALGDLRRRNPDRNVMLVCAGGDREGERFAEVVHEFAKDQGLGESVRMITDRGVFEPWLPHLYSAADVFVSPVDNIQETFGITPVEAMACGVPQVVSDWNGYRETVVHGETGFLVPTCWAACAEEIEWASLLSDPVYDHLALSASVAVDMGVLGQAVQRLLDDEALRRRMGEASRRRAETVYAWEHVIAAYETRWIDLGREARAVGPREPQSPGYSEPSYGRVFAEYASDMLEPSDELALTVAGLELLGTGTLPLHYNAAWNYLAPDMLRRILVGFQRSGRKGATLTPERIVSVMARGDSRGQATVLRHLMWLIKYGYVAVDPDRESSQSQ